MNIIKRLVPCFTIKDSNIKILADPNEFYQLLMHQSKSCKKRIIVASLYLGTGDLETLFINNVLKSVKTNHSNKNFRLHFLFDSNRGSRPVFNPGNVKTSRTMCIPILENLDRAKISFYHTPNLRGYLQRMLPNRVNEVVGLQHMKIYLFDDCLIISGANLSTDYFTNRQDRYVVFNDCPDLCDFYEELVDIVGTMSYKMTLDNKLTPPHNVCDPIEGNFNEYVSKFRTEINDFISRQLEKSENRLNKEENSLTENLTQVYPLIQMGLYKVHQDQNVLQKLFTFISTNKTQSYKVSLASGYFNLDDENERSLLNMARNNIPIEVLTAHPEANGFYRAKGTSGYIPDVYSDILKRFMNKSADLLVDIYEWKRSNWTFHAKGFWINENDDGQSRVTMTLVGSTNYGYRSRYRDLETEILINTHSPILQKQLEKEKSILYQYGANVVNRVVIIPYWIHWAVPLIKYFF